MLTHKIVKKCKSDIEFKCLCWELWHGWGSPGALWIPEGKQIPTITMRSRAIIKFTKRKVFSWCTSTLHLPTFHSFRRKKLSPYLHLKSFASRKKKRCEILEIKMKNHFISHYWNILESFSLQDATPILKIFTFSFPLFYSIFGSKSAFYSKYLVCCTSLLGIPCTTLWVQPASYVSNDWV